jgi:hypothetical protein
LNGTDSENPLVLDPGAGLELAVRIASRDGRVPQLALGITRADGSPVYGTSSEIGAARPQRADPGQFVYRLCFGALPLLPGGYVVRAHAMDTEALRLFDTVERPFVVRGASREFGMVRLQHRWLEGESVPRGGIAGVSAAAGGARVVIPITRRLRDAGPVPGQRRRHVPDGVEVELVDDASRDPRVAALLDGAARRVGWRCERQPRNLGFVAP